MSRTIAAFILVVSSGVLLHADSIPIGFVSIDIAVPIGGIDTIGVGNLTGLTYGCSFAAGFPVCKDLTLTGSVTLQFLDGAVIDTEVIPLSSNLSPGLYDPPEFQFLDSRVLL